MRNTLFFIFLVNIIYAQNIPVTSIRGTSGPNNIIKTGVNGKPEWAHDSIYFGKVYSSAISPITAKKGDFWKSTANGNTYYWDGVTWQLIASNTYTIDQIDSLQNLKANLSHTHTVSQVTGLQDSLNARATQTALDDKVSGSGQNGRIAFWSGVKALNNDSDIFWDNSTKRLGINNNNPLAEIHVGNYNQNPSSNAKILISKIVDYSNMSGHGFSDGSIIRNGQSYASYDARVTIDSSITIEGGHNASFQSVPILNDNKILDTHYGLYDSKQGNGVVNNHYGAFMLGAPNTINYSGLLVSGTLLTNTVNAFGMNLVNLNSSNAYGVNISGVNGSSLSRGISITQMAGNNRRPVYTEHNTSFSPNELKFTGNGDSDMLLFSRGSVNGGEKIGMLWEAGGGVVKYYSNRISSSFDSNLFGDIIFDTNHTGGSGLGSLTEKFRIKGNGNVGIGTSTPSEKLDVSGNIKAIIPSYASTAAAAADSGLTAGSMFKVSNGNGTSQLHIKD